MIIRHLLHKSIERDFFKVLSFVVFLGIACIFWPGYMSADSLSQYGQSIGYWPLDNQHPMLMALTWRVMNGFLNTSGGMLVLHLAIFYLSTTSLISTSDSAFGKLAITLVPTLPWIINFSGVIWKDVGMAYALVGTYALLKNPNRGWNLILAVALLCYAVNVRYNGIFAVIPILVYVFWVCSFQFKKPKTYIIYCITGALLFAPSLILTMLYNPKPQNHTEDVAVFDTGVLLLESASIKIKTEERTLISRCVYPDGKWPNNRFASAQCLRSNLPDGVTATIYDYRFLQQAFVSVFKSHIKNVASLIKLRSLEPFYIFHNGIDENNFGLSNNETYETLLKYWVYGAAKIAPFFFLPSFYLIINVLVTILIIQSSEISHKMYLLAYTISVLMYVSSYLISAPSDDFRYLYFQTLLTHIVIFHNRRYFQSAVTSFGHNIKKQIQKNFSPG